MSSLWTPGGEHEVPHDDDVLDEDDDVDPIELAEAEAAMAAELDAARRRLSQVPAEQVVANHAMGLFELAAIHLSAEPTHLSEAALAIDALGTLVEGLEGRLGEAEPTLRDALSQIRLALVQVRAGIAT
jgi:hypothetical protein